jgi:hypothetical protein
VSSTLRCSMGELSILAVVPLRQSRKPCLQHVGSVTGLLRPSPGWSLVGYCRSQFHDVVQTKVKVKDSKVKTRL